MIYDPQYWFWKAELPVSVCKAIIEEGMNLTANTGTVGGSGPNEFRVDESVRNSKTAFFENSNWLLGISNYYCTLANQNAGWNFEITGQQVPQFTIYGENEFYDFHSDSSLHEEGMRKLSLVISISDPKEYEGGVFEFENGVIPEISDQGTVMVFPSDLRHRVTPVTKGTRYSFVNWFTGPKMR